MGKHFHPAHRMSNFLEQHHRRHRYAPMPMRGMSMLPDIALWRLFFYWAKSLPMKREQRWLNHNPHHRHRASDCCARMPVRQCLPPSQLSNTFRGIFRIICCLFITASIVAIHGGALFVPAAPTLASPSFPYVCNIGVYHKLEYLFLPSLSSSPKLGFWRAPQKWPPLIILVIPSGRNSLSR
jgi:hypothetical protein